MSKSAITPPPNYGNNSVNNLNNYNNDAFNNAPSDVKPSKQQLELISRTVYVSNIDVQISETELVDFFNEFGDVSNYRLCGDNQHPTRFAFFEFAKPKAAAIAVDSSGTMLGDYPVRISASKTSIQASHKNVSMFNTPEHKGAIGKTIYCGNLDDNVGFPLFFFSPSSFFFSFLTLFPSCRFHKNISNTSSKSIVDPSPRSPCPLTLSSTSLPLSNSQTKNLEIFLSSCQERQSWARSRSKSTLLTHPSWARVRARGMQEETAQQ